MENWAPNPPSRIGDARSRRQRRAETIQRYAATLAQPMPTNSTSIIPNPTPQFSSPRGRISGIVPPQSQLHRHRLRRQETSENFETVQETLNDLENDRRTSQLNPAGLNQTLPIPTRVEEFYGLQENPEDHGRRNKRRKIDGSLPDAMPKISYGYHGQVVPGRLNMMISYCDGGLHHDERQYSQNNVLQNDKSVYCSRKNKVNILLSHWGEVPFTCSKIVIKTPDSGFSAPTQEGMVFVFMGGNNMLETTSGFQVQEPFSETHTLSAPPTSDPTRRRSRLRSDSGSWQAESNGNRLGASYVMNDILAAFDFDAFLTEPPQVIRAETLSSQEDMPPLSRVSRTALPLPTESTYHDNIAVSCDPPTDDEEDQSSESVLDDRRRRNHALDTESENDTDEIRHPLSHKYVRQWPHPRPIQWLGKASSISTTEPKPPGPDVPYKRFFIEQRKHVVSIKFDPPVSGKHILLKFWSLQDKDRVDLQSICVYGFAGPRLFPVLATR